MTALRFPKPVRPEKEHKPLRRKAWMKRRAPRRLDTAQSNPAYLAFVHEQPCCLAGPRCSGRIEAHHAGRKPGLALKAHDDTCVPLCTRHHDELTTRRGVFSGMSREALRALQDEWIGATRSRYLSHGGRRG